MSIVANGRSYQKQLLSSFWCGVTVRNTYFVYKWGASAEREISLDVVCWR